MTPHPGTTHTHTVICKYIFAHKFIHTCTVTIIHSCTDTHTKKFPFNLSFSPFSSFRLFFFAHHSGRPMSITNRSLMNDRIRGSLTSLTASLDLAPTHSVPAPNQGTYAPRVILSYHLILSYLMSSYLILS
jgi:hypothetical protein